MVNGYRELGGSKVSTFKHSVIDISEIDGRLDAEHYDAEAVKCVELLSSLSNIVELKQLAGIVSGPFGSTLHASAYRKRGIPFIRASNVRDLFITGEMVYISELDHDRLRSSKMGINDIVFYKIGAGLGSIGLLTDDFPKANISENMIGIKPFDKGASAFIAVFLLTEYGKLQIERQKSFQAQPKINVTDIERILIPKVENRFLLSILSLIQEAYHMQKEADQMYDEATRVLDEALEVKLFKQSDRKTYIASNRSVEDSNTIRLDANYYGSTFDYTNVMLNHSISIEKMVDIVEDTINPKENPTRQFKYISLKSIDEITGEINRIECPLGWQAPSRARLLVRSRDILVSSLKGSVGKVAMVPDELDGAVASNGFFAIRETCNKLPAELLFVLFRVPFIKSQLERLASGGILEAVSNTEFKRLIVPVVQSEEINDRVALLVRKSFELRKKSRQCIDDAKRKIEEYVKGKIEHAPSSE